MPTVGPAGAGAIAERTAAAGKVVSEGTSGRSDGAPRSVPISRPMMPDTPGRRTSPRSAHHSSMLHRKSRRAAKFGCRPARGGYRSREDSGCDGDEGINAPGHFNLPRSPAMQPVAVVPQPITPRQVPFVRPNLRGNQMRLRTSEKIRLQHPPGIVPDRPVIPPPIFAMVPSPPASAAVMNHVHDAVPGRVDRCRRRRNRQRRSALRWRAKPSSAGEDHPGDKSSTHAFLLPAAANRPPTSGRTGAILERIRVKSNGPPTAMKASRSERQACRRRLLVRRPQPR